MNYITLKKILSKSNNMAVIISSILILMGLAIMINSIVSIGGKKTISIVLGLIFGLLFAVLGSIAFKRLLTDQLRARKGTHPILLAIDKGQKDYLVWVYVEQINTTLGNNGATVGTSKNINYFTKDCKGKGKTIMTGKEYSASEIIDYLSSEFDIPYLDYSDETRAAMNQYFATRGMKKL